MSIQPYRKLNRFYFSLILSISHTMNCALQKGHNRIKEVNIFFFVLLFSCQAGTKVVYGTFFFLHRMQSFLQATNNIDYVPWLFAFDWFDWCVEINSWKYMQFQNIVSTKWKIEQTLSMIEMCIWFFRQHFLNYNILSFYSKTNWSFN